MSRSATSNTDTFSKGSLSSSGGSSGGSSGEDNGTDIAHMKAFMQALKQSYEVYYPEKDPYGHIIDKPLPFPQATTELIRWTTTFIDQIAYKYSKEVEVSRIRASPPMLPLSDPLRDVLFMPF